MPVLSAVDILNVVLGAIPGFLLGILVGYWYEHASRVPRRTFRAAVLAPRAVIHQSAPIVPPPLIRALGAAILGNIGAPRATDPPERGEPLAPGLNEYGEVVDARPVGRRE